MALKEIQNCYGEQFRWIRDGLTLKANSAPWDKKGELQWAAALSQWHRRQDGTRHHNIQPLPWPAETKRYSLERRYLIWVPSAQQQICSANQVFLPYLRNSPLLPAPPSCQVYQSSSWGQATSCVPRTMTGAAHLFKPDFLTRRAWNSFLKQTLT